MSAPHPLIHVVSDAMASASHDILGIMREITALHVTDFDKLSRDQQTVFLTNAAGIMRRGGLALLRSAILYELVASAQIESTP